MKLKKGKFLGAIVLSLFLLASCRSLKNTNTLFQSEYDKFADTAKSVYVANGGNARSNGYKIQPHDLISVKNLQNPDGFSSNLTSEANAAAVMYRGDEEGKFTLPVVGQVELRNLTQVEASNKLQNLYSRTLLKNPIIEVTIINSKVTILGEVNRQGNYQLEKENITLIDILGRSGGPTSFADMRKVKIIRANSKGPEIIFVNLKDIKSLTSKKLVLDNNDIVYVAPKGVYGMTEGIKNYTGFLQPALLLLNGLMLVYTINRL